MLIKEKKKEKGRKKNNSNKIYCLRTRLNLWKATNLINLCLNYGIFVSACDNLECKSQVREGCLTLGDIMSNWGSSQEHLNSMDMIQDHLNSMNIANKNFSFG